MPSAQRYAKEQTLKGIRSRLYLLGELKKTLSLPKPESLCVRSHSYDPIESVMTIEFMERGTYKYYDFPLSEYNNFAQASSLGTYFNLYIRNSSYEFERVD